MSMGLTNDGFLSGKLEYQVFSRSDAPPTELRRVTGIAERLRVYLSAAETVAEIKRANVLGKPSQLIQECLATFLTENNFQSEKRGLFAKYKTSNLRPDYYHALSPGRGIILEVERGKTTANNMDFFDIWKCHICHEAQYLFLLVPRVRPNKKGTRENVFPRVVNRMGPFFLDGNYINVFGLFLFGY